MGGTEDDVTKGEPVTYIGIVRIIDYLNNSCTYSLLFVNL